MNLTEPHALHHVPLPDYRDEDEVLWVDPYVLYCSCSNVVRAIGSSAEFVQPFFQRYRLIVLLIGCAIHERDRLFA